MLVLKLITYTLILMICNVVLTIHFPKLDQFYSDQISKSDYYTLISKKVTERSFQFLLHYAHFTQFEKPGKQSIVENTAEYMSLEVFILSKDSIQFIFRDANQTRFELPCQDPFPCHKYIDNMVHDFNMSNLDYDYEMAIKESPFSFTLLRKKTKEILFTTMNRKIIFKNNYAEISTDLPSENLFGLGERTTTFKIKSGIYTLYNKDLYGELEDGKGKGKNRYGSHPMYLMRERSGNYHISYLRNSFPMDIQVDHEKSKLNYKIVGGVLDFTFFMGNDNPETAIKMYHKYLGGYSMPPFWAMGFHQCRWGYKNLHMIKDVLTSYQVTKIPLDTIWSDIDYMDSHMPFTIDKENFNLMEFKKTLHLFKKKYMMIMEPSMGTKWPKYEYLTRGINEGIFIKNGDGHLLRNRVWPGQCHFIDYFNPKTKPYWEDALGKFYDQINYSGVWLDMNEIAAFSPGQVDNESNEISCNDKNEYPYLPGSKPFETATICPNAVHYNNMTHIEVHNYYPNMQSKLTYEFLEKLYPNKFPFILTRANAPGIGKYAAHWSGDNYGRFSFYKFSISEVLNFNLFGAPMTGADICGFGEDTPEVLCAKWYQLGSLYPFSRSHAHIDSYRKEPFAMGRTLLDTTKKSLQFRYSVLKFYYTLFMLNKGAGTIFRPLFFEFYKDPACLENLYIDNFFMIGSSLLVIPNLHDDDKTTLTPAYFPYGDWFDLRDKTRVNKRSYEPELININTTLRQMAAVFLRSGKTIFTNDIENVRNSSDLDNDYNFLIAIDNKETSHGVIPALIDYDSKKDVEKCMEKNCYINIDTIVSKANSEIKITFSKAEFYNNNYTSMKISKFVIFGLKVTPNINANKEYEIEYINDYCFEVKIRNKVEIKKIEVNLIINIGTS